MNDLEYAMRTRRGVLDQSTALLNNALKSSHGQSEMSPADTKLAILALQGTVKDQFALIETLYNELNKPKKSFIKKLFRK